MKAYWINAAERTITATEYESLTDMQRLVGGHIELAKVWPTGDVLYVDEEARLKRTNTFFRMPGQPFPLCGNGLVVGREIAMTEKTYEPSITIDQLRAEVSFLTPEQVQAWARANSSEPAVVFYTAEGADVRQRVGEVFDAAPPKANSEAR